MSEVIERYRATVSPDISLLLSQHTVTDVGASRRRRRKRRNAVLHRRAHRPRGEPLVLQVKEAAESVIHEFGGVPVGTVAGVDPDIRRGEPGLPRDRAPAHPAGRLRPVPRLRDGRRCRVLRASVPRPQRVVRHPSDERADLHDYVDGLRARSSPAPTRAARTAPSSRATSAAAHRSRMRSSTWSHSLRPTSPSPTSRRSRAAVAAGRYESAPTDGR